MRYKKQHNNPAMYLKRFVDLSNQSHEGPFTPYVWIYDRKEKTWDRTAPKKALRKLNFYTLYLPNGNKSTVIEESLGKIESAASRILDDIEDYNPVTPEKRVLFAEFIAAMNLRTPFRRDNINQMLRWADRYAMGLLVEHPDELKAAIKDCSKSQTSDHDIAELREIIKSEPFDVVIPNTYGLLSMIENLPIITKIISGMKWNYLVAPLNNFFISSDNPVVLFDPLHTSDFYGLGFLTKSIELTFPLSSHICMLCEHNSSHENEFIHINSEQVIKINERTVSCSYQYLISSQQSLGVPFSLSVQTADRQLRQHKDTPRGYKQ